MSIKEVPFDVPDTYDRSRAVEDLSDLVMRLMLAANRAGLLEEVSARVEHHLDRLRSDKDG